MGRALRIGLAQINTTVGDLDGNRDKIIHYVEQARGLGVDVVAFPELAIPGYPPEDLLLKPEFIRANLKTLHQIIPATKGITAIIGFVDSQNDIYNAAAILHDGALAGIYHKRYLPNYAVFDEERYFQAENRDECPLFVVNGVPFGVSICEDIWYPVGPAVTQALGGAEVLINISASPYHAGKGLHRERMLATRAADSVAVVAFVNLVGGQDELIFDGDSAVLDERGTCLARGKQFEEDFVALDVDVESVFRQRLHDPRRRREALSVDEALDKVALSETGDSKPPLSRPQVERLDPVAEVYRALVLGTGDYVRKNGFQKVVVGLSGGIDSSLTAVIAAEALGADNVIGVSMPSRHSSEGSRADAHRLADNLGMELLTIPIDQTFQAYLEMMAAPFAGHPPDVAEENIQARIRGNILMALSNKFGWLVLTTGNKSEASVGYCTLYGDMAGGFAVIKDVLKGMVYALSDYVNKQAATEIIPRSVFEKAPSAELRPNQKDSDSLPPYPVLDPILKAYVEEDMSATEIVALGHQEGTVRQVIAMVDKAEYKRRQSPPGVRISHRAFGKDRRLPITNRFKGHNL
jgi:NAD+ synthase (glutamine-hydrolysing)